MRSKPSTIACLISLVVTSLCKSIKDFDQLDFLSCCVSQSFLMLKLFVSLISTFISSFFRFRKDSLLLIRKGVVASREIQAGQLIEKEDLIYARPATEFKSNELLNLIGKVCSSNIKKGHTITKKNILI